MNRPDRANSLAHFAADLLPPDLLRWAMRATGKGASVMVRIGLDLTAASERCAGRRGT
jgi:hypothetical protein